MSEEKTYQPDWGKKHKHHHQHASDERNKGFGGALRMRDKQAYYGLVVIIVAVLSFGAYKVIKMYAHEIKAMPMDDPKTEANVDVLRIRRADEQDAIQYSDSLAQATGLDSIQRTVRIETIPVYRPPRKENKWYITRREWKSIWKDYKIWRWERKHDKEQQNE